MAAKGAFSAMLSTFGEKRADVPCTSSLSPFEPGSVVHIFFTAALPDGGKASSTAAEKFYRAEMMSWLKELRRADLLFPLAEEMERGGSRSATAVLDHTHHATAAPPAAAAAAMSSPLPSTRGAFRLYRLAPSNPLLAALPSSRKDQMSIPAVCVLHTSPLLPDAVEGKAVEVAVLDRVKEAMASERVQRILRLLEQQQQPTFSDARKCTELEFSASIIVVALTKTWGGKPSLKFEKGANKTELTTAVKNGQESGGGVSGAVNQVGNKRRATSASSKPPSCLQHGISKDKVQKTAQKKEEVSSTAEKNKKKELIIEASTSAKSVLPLFVPVDWGAAVASEPPSAGALRLFQTPIVVPPSRWIPPCNLPKNPSPAAARVRPLSLRFVSEDFLRCSLFFKSWCFPVDFDKSMPQPFVPRVPPKGKRRSRQKKIRGEEGGGQAPPLFRGDGDAQRKEKKTGAGSFAMMSDEDLWRLLMPCSPADEEACENLHQTIADAFELESLWLAIRAKVQLTQPTSASAAKGQAGAGDSFISSSSASRTAPEHHQTVQEILRSRPNPTTAPLLVSHVLAWKLAANTNAPPEAATSLPRDLFSLAADAVPAGDVGLEGHCDHLLSIDTALADSYLAWSTAVLLRTVNTNGCEVPPLWCASASAEKALEDAGWHVADEAAAAAAHPGGHTGISVDDAASVIQQLAGLAARGRSVPAAQQPILEGSRCGKDQKTDKRQSASLEAAALALKHEIFTLDLAMALREQNVRHHQRTKMPSS
jgi:hypothetical protein